MKFYVHRAKLAVEKDRSKEEQNEIVLAINHFIRLYEFLIQVTCFEDVELHKKI